jgi:hypothetical protein
VLEVSHIPRTERRLRGKDDALDAARIARTALAANMIALPRAGERREALRLLLVARRSAVDVRREALTQLRAVIVTAPEELRRQLRGLPTGVLLDRCSRFRRTRSRADELATRLVLRSLAQRIRARHPRSRPARTRTTRTRPRARTRPARRARRRTDRCRTADRRRSSNAPNSSRRACSTYRSPIVASLAEARGGLSLAPACTSRLAKLPVELLPTLAAIGAPEDALLGSGADGGKDGVRFIRFDREC